MSLKNDVVRGIRRGVPQPLVRGLEEGYRRSRASVVAARYGFPARSLKVIAVTGTNGKTTTVNFLNEILKNAGHRTAMFSTAVIEVAGDTKANDLNATVATVSRMQQFFQAAKRAHVDYVVMEFPSHALHQHKLAGVPVEVAIMTNLTQDHLDYHGTMEAYADVKARLFRRQPRFIVLNRDDDWYDYFSQFPAAEQTLSYGQDANASAHLTHIREAAQEVSGNVTIHGKKLELTSHLPGVFNLYNAAAAACAAVLLGVKPGDIERGVALLAGIPGRFERVPNQRELDIIVDYAHTPDGLEKLLVAARDVTTGAVHVVFGACGDRDRSKRPIMGEIAARLADHVIVTDEENYTEDAAQIRAHVLEGAQRAATRPGQVKEIADRRQAIKTALERAKEGDTILVTGLGHEVYRIIDGKRVAWNDRDVITDLLK